MESEGWSVGEAVDSTLEADSKVPSWQYFSQCETR